MLTELSTQKQFPTVTGMETQNFFLLFCFSTHNVTTYVHYVTMFSIPMYNVKESYITNNRGKKRHKQTKNTKTNKHVSSTHFYFLFVAKPISKIMSNGELETLNWIRQFVGLRFCQCFLFVFFHLCYLSELYIKIKSFVHTPTQ